MLRNYYIFKKNKIYLDQNLVESINLFIDGHFIEEQIDD